MIFVTVGTHEQPFNRLVKQIDELVINGSVNEKVIVQKGYTEYTPKVCETYTFLSNKEMENYYKKARIIITHGGPASFLGALQVGKVPIVVPRMKKFNEHINNHQVDFVRFVDKKRKNIIPVYDINKLGSTIKDYTEIIRGMGNSLISNNKKFNIKFNEIVESMFRQE